MLSLKWYQAEWLKRFKAFKKSTGKIFRKPGRLELTEEQKAKVDRLWTATALEKRSCTLAARLGLCKELVDKHLRSYS